MRKNIIFKILASFPIILVALYFIPFLGVCLILLRYFMYNNKRISTPIIIALIGLLIVIPNIVCLVLDMLKYDVDKVPYFASIVKSELYSVNFINYSKLLICVGVISLIISFVLKSIFDRVSSKLNNQIKNYVNEQQQMNYEISKKNDMEIKLMKEKAKNTSYVKCSNCGADNLVSEKNNVCKYCRSILVNKNYKNS